MPVIRIISPIILSLFLACAVSAASPQEPEIRPLLAGNQFLIITADSKSGQRLGEIFSELYGANVQVKPTEKYIPIIDEATYDAFIYYGNHYFQRPSQKFIDDIERTHKPVLWINYHGWMLNQDFLGSKGIRIFAEHDASYNQIDMQGRFSLPRTDTTTIISPPDQVIYWLLSPYAKKTPGAVVSENLTFVSYKPSLDIFAPDFFPFLTAIQSTFGHVPAPAHKLILNYQDRVKAAREDTFRTGVHLPVYVSASQGKLLGYDNDKWHENLVRIKQSGAEWVNIVRTFRQTDIHSADVEADELFTPSLASLENIIRDAHQLGLMVQLHLAINLKNRGPDDWHGRISPKDSPKWWAAYQALVIEMAQFSERNEVEALIIGTEYSALQSDEHNWRELIRQVRDKGQYSGMVGYGTNYNMLEIPWVDALDFLGISAYWPLSEDRAPDIKTLNRSWGQINQQLDKWMTQHPSLRVEFSEIGYTSQPYAAVLPFSWKAHKGGQQNLSEQLQSYRALYQFLNHKPAIKGVHIFASTAEDDDPGSIGYTPFGKPAEDILKQIMQIH